MMKYLKNNKSKLLIIVFSFFISLLTLLFCSKNSPLYPFNNWVDENAFFTVARSWINGIIPYKDIFEQKGPMLYLIFIIAYFISKNSFLGVFILEVINMTVCLYYCSKIIRLFLKENYVYYILPLFVSIVCSCRFFVHGGSTEEFCYSFIAISLYSLLSHFLVKEIDYKKLFINGLIAGIVSMMKFNLLGFWFIFMASIFISLIYAKKIKKAFISCIFFLLGMMIPIISFVIYFLSVHGLEEFINTYILFNVNNYSEKISIAKRIVSIFKVFYQQLTINFIIFSLIFIGIIYLLFSKKIIKNNICKITILLLILVSSMGIYWGLLDFRYYFLFITFFIIFGLIVVFYHIFENKKLDRLNYVILPVVFIISIILVANSNNLYYMSSKKNDLVQYKFAKEIGKNKTLLNYGFLDGGFYFASDILPNTKYFESQNAPIPNMDDILNKEISQKKFDYIVIRKFYAFDPTNEYITKNYTKVLEEKEILEDIEFTYVLYKKKGNDNND